MSRILVTGCGRAATQYMANLLNAIGLKAAHESVYTVNTDPDTFDVYDIATRWSCKDVEVSWLGAAFVPTLADDITVWHQLRHPLKVIRCWADHKLLSGGEGTQPPPLQISKFVCKILPECSEGTDLERAIQYYIGWNGLLDKYQEKSWYRRYRIETLTPEHLVLLLEGAGFKRSVDQILDGLDGIDRHAGSCWHNPDTNLSWKDVLKQKGGKDLYAMAVRYGYEKG